jgi:plastocyanin
VRTLILAAILAALTACASGGSDAPDEPDLALELADFMLDPSDLTVSGPTVAIEVSNAGPTPHNLTIRDAAGDLLAATMDLSRGETETLTVDLAPGTYTIFCALPGHESLGMRGVLTVEAP